MRSTHPSKREAESVSDGHAKTARYPSLWRTMALDCRVARIFSYHSSRRSHRAQALDWYFHVRSPRLMAARFHWRIGAVRVVASQFFGYRSKTLREAPADN